MKKMERKCPQESGRASLAPQPADRNPTMRPMLHACRWESVVLLLVYGAYIAFMFYNEKLLGKCRPLHQDAGEQVGVKGCGGVAEEDGAATVVSRAPSASSSPKKVAPVLFSAHHFDTVECGSPPPRGHLEGEEKKDDDDDEAEHSLLHRYLPTSLRLKHACSASFSKRRYPLSFPPLHHVFPDWPSHGRFQMPESRIGKAFHVLSLPFLIVFTLTIPDSAHPWYTSKCPRIYWASFTMSIVWIGILCHLMVDFGLKLACICKV